MKHDIDERHEILVPCALAPHGKHRLVLLRAGLQVVHLAGECGAAGDAARMLGQVTCAQSVAAIRHELATLNQHGSSRFEGGVAANTIVDTGAAEVTLATLLYRMVGAAVNQSASLGGELRSKREPDATDDRPILVRFQEKQLHLLGKGACNKMTIKIDASGLRKIIAPHRGYSYGRQQEEEGVAIAQRMPGEPWGINTSVLYDQAKNFGYGTGTGYGAHNVCRVCPEAKDKNWSDVRTHARGKPHGENVRRLVRAAIEALPTGVRRG